MMTTTMMSIEQPGVFIRDELSGVRYEERVLSSDVSEHAVSHAPSSARTVATLLLVLSLFLLPTVATSLSAPLAAYVVAVLAVVWRERQRVVCERVLVLRRLGVQLCVERANGAVECRFVPREATRCAVLNEAICWNRVVHYVALLPSRDGERLVVLFQHFEPRLACLLRILHALQT
jgi:hypothetical protein